MTEPFSHLDDDGEVHMVDVSGKQPTVRTAVAEATLAMTDATRSLLFGGDLPKGDALASARVAGIMAAKQTPQLIPLCHPLPIDAVDVDISEVEGGARITATVTTTARTGVEMEALTAASVAALALYDMVKSVERSVSIEAVRLMSKRGGKSGDWVREV